MVVLIFSFASRIISSKYKDRLGENIHRELSVSCPKKERTSIADHGKDSMDRDYRIIS